MIVCDRCYQAVSRYVCHTDVKNGTPSSKQFCEVCSKIEVFECNARGKWSGTMTEIEIWAEFERMQGDIAAEIRVMLGEAAYAQAIFDSAQRQRRVDSMKLCAAQDTSDIERHESWMKMHVDAGWVYGEKFDPAAKTHPNLLPFDQLPATMKSKARIFDICSKTAARLATGCSRK